MEKHPRKSFIIFADGASSGNPGKGGWGSILLSPLDEITEMGGFDPMTTNNRMELAAVIHPLERIKQFPEAAEVYTDSTYVILGITQWIWKWSKNQWQTQEGKEIANLSQWKALFSLTRNKKVSWKYVRGHSGVPGNERVDQIAVHFAQGKRIELFHGPLAHYAVPLLEIPSDTSLPPRKSESSKAKSDSTQSVFYLSCVDGHLSKHSTWSECESAVKGKSGALYRKITSPEQEAEVVKNWRSKMKLK